MADTSKYAYLDNMGYWTTEALEILNMIDDENTDNIAKCLEIAAYIRGFYLRGKEVGVWEYNNAPRG